MNSIIQDWAAELGLRHQGVLVSAIRGCDGQLREDHSKHLVRFYRSCVLKAHCGHPKDAVSYMIWPDYQVNMTAWENEFFEGGMDHYPMHWLTHFMFAVEILGYHYPHPSPHSSDLKIKEFWCHLYLKMTYKLHVHPETAVELDLRLGLNEKDFGVQQVV